MGYLNQIKLVELEEQEREFLTYLELQDILGVQHLMNQYSSPMIDNPNFKMNHHEKPVKYLRKDIHLHLQSRIHNTQDCMKSMAQSFLIILTQDNFIILEAVANKIMAEVDFRNIMDIHISFEQQAKNTMLEVYYILELERITELAMHCNLELEEITEQEVYCNLVQEYITKVRIQNPNIKLHCNPFNSFYCQQPHLTVSQIQ